MRLEAGKGGSPSGPPRPAWQAELGFSPRIITAASEMRPYQPTAKTDPVGADLPAARRERHGRQNWASHRDKGRLGDAFRRGVFIA